MLAEPTDQRRLLDLVRSDTELGRLTHAARTLPQHKRIQELMQARQEAGESLVEATTVVGDLEAGVARAESDLTPVRARLERDQKRIDDGSVTDSKTLKGLLDEVEYLKGRIAELEDVELQVMGDLEAAQAVHARITETKGDVEEQLREQVAQRDEEVARLKAEAKEVAARRQAEAAAVPGDLLALYEKLRASRGTGAGELNHGRCSGCQLEIPASDLARYRKAPLNEVLRCVECDRILVRTQNSGV